MPRQEEYHLHPLGWESDPEEERVKLSTLDYLAACTYNNYALFFPLSQSSADQAKVIDVLKAGLERSLSQARHLVGIIEKDADGGHSFVKQRDSTVKLVVQWLDGADDKFPSFTDIEKAHFVSTALGDIKVLSNEPMTYGEKPEADPNSRPITASFKANFIPGGLILNMHSHHYSNDVMGWASFTHQLAENCYAEFHKTTPPNWDPACEDLSRFVPVNIPDEAKIDGPAPPDRHPDHRVSQSLLFHLPPSKAAALKAAAAPSDGTWISTYDAASALIWRTLSKLRQPLYKPDAGANLLWGEAVNMRRRLKSPPVPERVQRNVFFAALSATAPTPQLSAAEVMTEAPLWRIARYVRALTDGTTEEGLSKTLEMVAPIRDKTTLFIRINSFAPMSIVMTDWRDTKICEADFGFARPRAFRHLFDTVTEGLVIIYPPREPTTPGTPEGMEFAIVVEKELAQSLIEEPEWSKYFEYRGVDGEDAAKGAESLTAAMA